jgi:hypothetical protein
MTGREFGNDRTSDFDLNTNNMSHYRPSSENTKTHRQSPVITTDKMSNKPRAGFIKRNNGSENVPSIDHSDTAYSYIVPKEYLKFSMKHKPRMYKEIRPVKAEAYSSFCLDSHKKVESKHSDRATLSARKINRYEVINESKTPDVLGSQRTHNGFNSKRKLLTPDKSQSVRSPYTNVSSRAQECFKSTEDSVKHDVFYNSKVFSIEMLEKAIRDVGNNKIQYKIDLPSTDSNTNFQSTNELNIPSSK